MRKKTLLFILFIIIFIVAVIFILSPNEKRRIRHDLNALKTAVESKNINEALLYVSRDYYDQHHNDFESFSYSLQHLVDNFDSIKVTLTGIKVTVDSVDSSKIVFAACSMGMKVFARYENEKTLLFGGIVKPASVKAYFKKSNRNYQIYHARY